MIVHARYNGPADSGNGGWTAGLVAEEAIAAGVANDHADAVAVTLRRPPPLETPMSAVPGDGPLIRVYAGSGDLVAEGSPATVDPDQIKSVSYAEAIAASATYPGLTEHPFPTCFVCGPDRAEGDGLRLFPGRVADGVTATPWRVPDDVSVPMVWAALDCPGGWSVGIEARPFVLGRMATRVDVVPAPGTECVVMGHLLSTQGRKALVASTLFDAARSALAVSRATWIAIG